MDVINGLQDLGWSQLEARVYVALLESGQALTGYQIAKASHVARANVYPVLDRLVRRGAVVESPGTDAVRYSALPFELVSQTQLSRWSQKLKDLAQALDRAARPPRIIVGRGEQAVLTHGLALIRKATYELAIGASCTTVKVFEEPLAQARLRGIHEQFWCFDRCSAPGCGICQDPLLVAHQPFRATGWFMLVRDQKESLIVAGQGKHLEVLVTDLAPIRETVTMLLSLRNDKAPEPP